MYTVLATEEEIKEHKDTNKENMIDFITNSRMCTCSFTNRKHINRIKKLYEQRKSEFEYFYENKDGSVCARIPLKWIKINPGSLPDAPRREMSEEHKAKLLAGKRKSIENK